MAFPTTPVLDAATRANVGPPPSASWTVDLRGASVPGLAVVSNQLKSLTGTEASSWWSATTFRDDCEAYVKCVTASPETELWARGSGFGGGLPQGYLVYFDPALGLLMLQKYGPGAAPGWVTLGATLPFSIAAGDSIGISVIGTTVTAWSKVGAGAWTAVITRTDTTFPTGGQIGLLTYSTANIYDDFGGGSANVPISPSGTITPAGKLTRQWKRTLTGLITPSGTLARGRAMTDAGTITPAGALTPTKVLAPTVVPATTYPDGMDEMLYAALPFPEAQAQLAMPGVSGGTLLAASCGWHGTSFDPERGCFAIVASDGPLAHLVGERLAVSRRDTTVARTVYVYCHTDSSQLTEEISLTRRAFMALGDPALDDVPVVVDTVTGING